jgi:hypothetical protein
MTEVVVATLNVTFNTDEDAGTAGRGTIKLEIDDREDGLNGGDTSFSPGDDAYFFMFKDESVTLITNTPVSTAGGVSSAGSGIKAIEDQISFTNSDTSSLNYPPNGGVSLEWFGRSYALSGTTLSINNTLPEISGSELKIPGGKKVIGVLKCTYNTTGSLWKLSSVPVDITEVVIVAIGTV